jgi:hypothetical protein
MTQENKPVFKDFVGIFENAYTKEYCEQTIECFNKLDELGFSLNRKEHENANSVKKDDKVIFFDTFIPVEHTTSAIHDGFLTSFWDIFYPLYAQKYSVLTDSSDKHAIYCNKMQKTEVGGGYHVWHYESSSRTTGNRLLAYILYLNDVEDGGETEFLYLHSRIKPKAGTLIIFPAAFTHTHRGNPPLSNTKYITTGWVEF